MTDTVAFNLRFATDHQGALVTLRFAGAPTEAALPHIVAALQRAGRPEDGVPGFALSPSDAFSGGDDFYDTQFLLLQGDETLGELRSLIGPDDSAAILRTTGWGGSDLPEMFHWVMSDLLPFGRALLEIYGAVEVIRVVGRAAEARRNRELRREADYWVRSGAAEPQGMLRDAVMIYDHWESSRAERTFGLDRAGTAKLLTACGFEFEPSTAMYVLLNA